MTVITTRYFSRYPPTNNKSITNIKIISAVDRLAGKMNHTTVITGSHRGTMEETKVILVSLNLLR